jgi:Mn2+/Fe2+ NRAMP family transporter
MCSRRAGVDTFVLLFLERLGARQLEVFFATLVATMTVAMGWMYFEADCPTGEVLKGALVPSLKYETLQQPCLANPPCLCRR